MNKKSLQIIYSVIIGLAGFGAFYVINKQVQFPARTDSTLTSTLNINENSAPEMRHYDAQRDKEFIKRQFKENWDMLISSPDYSIDDMLDNNSPHQSDIKHRGKLITKVLYYQGQQAGFGSCYMDTDVRGDILFVEVDKNFRGKKLAETIVKTQIEDLKNLGAKTVKLCTRVDNFIAQKLYTRLGFKETHRSKTHVYYRIDLSL